MRRIPVRQKVQRPVSYGEYLLKFIEEEAGWVAQATCVPFGNLPNGTEEDVQARKAALAFSSVAAISSGRLPDETGQWPVPPKPGCPPTRNAPGTTQ